MVKDSSSVSIATITWARSPGEELLLRRSLARLANRGMPVAIADAGTNPAFARFLETLPGVRVTVPSTPGLVGQVQARFDLAAGFGTAYTLYLEPDKELFVEQHLSDFIRHGLAAEGIGIALASRSTAAFDTFPPMQRYTEAVINRLCQEQFGIAGDYSYGPFLVASELAARVAGMEPRIGWGWRHALFSIAVSSGSRVVHVTDEYPCPPEQRSESDDDRRHRMRQLSENILGLLAVQTPER